MRPRVLDTSALIALHQGHAPVYGLLTRADAGQIMLAVPVSALAEANTTIQASTSEWEAVLLTAGLEVLTLAQHIAIEVGSWPGDLATRHVVHEAAALRAVVVTCRPSAYEGHKVPLLVV
jgi:hypothetical protein